MRFYELTINLKEKQKKKNFSPQELDSLLERISSFLPGSIVHQQKNSSFLSLEFYSEPEKIEELRKKLNAHSLKYVILTKEPIKQTGAALVKQRKTVSKSKSKVELEEIEKKLEEILSE